MKPGQDIRTMLQSFYSSVLNLWVTKIKSVIIISFCKNVVFCVFLSVYYLINAGVLYRVIKGGLNNELVKSIICSKSRHSSTFASPCSLGMPMQILIVGKLVPAGSSVWFPAVPTNGKGRSMKDEPSHRIAV